MSLNRARALLTARGLGLSMALSRKTSTAPSCRLFTYGAHATALCAHSRMLPPEQLFVFAYELEIRATAEAYSWSKCTLHGMIAEARA